MTLDLVTVLEWIGAILGLLGAYLLAIHNRYSRYGWVAFFLANIAMAAIALSHDRYGLLTQQIGFVGSSLLGLKRSGLLNIKRKAEIETPI